MPASRTPSAALSVDDVRSIVGEIVEERKRDAAIMSHRPSLSERSPVARYAMLFTLFALTAWIWLAPPEWMMPPAAPVPTQTFVEASDRVALYLVGQQVKQYERAHGRLPSSLGDIGQRGAAVKYDTTANGQFELTSRSGATFLRYRSDEVPDSLLRTSLKRIGAVPR